MKRTLLAHARRTETWMALALLPILIAALAALPASAAKKADKKVEDEELKLTVKIEKTDDGDQCGVLEYADELPHDRWDNSSQRLR